MIGRVVVRAPSIAVIVVAAAVLATLYRLAHVLLYQALRDVPLVDPIAA